MTKPHDGTPGDMEREIRELRVWEDAARVAWSIVAETAPEDCPGPAAVRKAVDRLDDDAIRFEAERDAALEKLAASTALRVRVERERATACKDRDAALADNAEMRAALEAQDEYARGAPAIVSNDAEYWRRVKTQEQRKATATRMREAALARPDLGAGMVVVPRGDVDKWRDLIIDLVFDLDAHPRAKKAAADLEALLKKGGG